MMLTDSKHKLSNCHIQEDLIEQKIWVYYNNGQRAWIPFELKTVKKTNYTESKFYTDITTFPFAMAMCMIMPMCFLFLWLMFLNWWIVIPCTVVMMILVNYIDNKLTKKVRKEQDEIHVEYLDIRDYQKEAIRLNDIK
jgi:hypothetical protein